MFKKKSQHRPKKQNILERLKCVPRTVQVESWQIFLKDWVSFYRCLFWKEGEFNGIYTVKMASSQISIRRGLVLVERSELRCASWVDIAMIVEVCMDVHGWKGVMTCFRTQVPFDA